MSLMSRLMSLVELGDLFPGQREPLDAVLVDARQTHDAPARSIPVDGQRNGFNVKRREITSIMKHLS